MAQAADACLEGNVSSFHIKDVGVVIIGRNEGERLVRALETAQYYCEQVVYVDSASTDGSVARAQDLGVTVVSLDDSLPLTAARGRRAGFERLLSDCPKCRFVQFVDGDCIIQPGWLQTAGTFLERNAGVAVVCGRRFEAYPNASFYNRLIDEEWTTPIGRAGECGGDSMMKVEALSAAGSFRADLRAGEEPELCSRLRARGWEIWRLDAAMTEHDAGIDRFSQWWNRAERGGFGYAQVWSATRNLPARLYGRQLASALFWAVAVPGTVLAITAVTGNWWLLTLLPVIFGLQLLSIASRARHDVGVSGRLRAAAMTMVIKFAEAKGVLRYSFGLGGASISYKALPIRPEPSGT